MILRSGNFWFFLLLSLNFWLVPLTPFGVADVIMEDWLMAFTVLCAVAVQAFAAPELRRWAFGACAVIVLAISVEEVVPSLKYLENGVFAVCFASVTVLYFRTMTHNLREVTIETVLAAACTFILIGMVFAAIFGLILEGNPAAFAAEDGVTGRYEMLCYSFATITTLGALIFCRCRLAKMATVFKS